MSPSFARATLVCACMITAAESFVAQVPKGSIWAASTQLFSTDEKYRRGADWEEAGVSLTRTNQPNGVLSFDLLISGKLRFIGGQKLSHGCLMKRRVSSRKGRSNSIGRRWNSVKTLSEATTQTCQTVSPQHTKLRLSCDRVETENSVVFVFTLAGHS